MISLMVFVFPSGAEIQDFGPVLAFKLPVERMKQKI
uniref:Uncharacterized protein n=1 Tax=Anguilla anguilla TaxID=7936 RepID=A0A0E9STY6_ANGAN